MTVHRQPAPSPAERAFANLQSAVALWDSGSRLAVANQRFYEMFGLTAEDAPIGTSLPRFAEIASLRGVLEGRDSSQFTELAISLAERRTGVTWDDQWPDGRVITVELRPDEAGGWTSTYEDISARQKADAHVAHMGRHDVLTTLPNRELFSERLRDAVARGRTVAVLAIDFVQFKQVNETLGHDSGDMLLRLTASRLTNVFGQSDTVARIGGDVFGVVLASSRGAEQALACGNRIIELLRRPFEIDGNLVQLDANVGIAIGPEDGRDADALMRHADLALYQAKADAHLGTGTKGDGRAVARRFDAEIARRRTARLDLEADLRTALTKNELELLYQPIVEAASGRVVSFEALMRWQHPARGTIFPVQFIPLAESTGLIVKMGTWALRRACAAVAQWPGHIKVAVNLSPVQFCNGDLWRDVREAIDSAGIQPHRLELEITESVFIKDPDRVRELLASLRKMGVRVSMDDFGTGYSSLANLRNFALDKIKIDKSFVDGIGQNPGDEAIIRAVASMAADIGVETVAEGVETTQQRAHLQAVGCSQLQGYLFSRPQVAAAIPRLIAGLGFAPA